MNKKLIIFTTLVASAALSACGSGTDGAPQPSGSEPSGSESSDLYVGKQVMWPFGNVDVCFTPTTDPNASHWRNIVQSWATSSWQSNANITFHGWGTCGDADGPNDGIQILFRDDSPKCGLPVCGPHTSGFGTQLVGVSPGMVLDNVYAGGTVGQGRGPYDVETLLGWVTVHEFGHALGFPHEQDRPDTISSTSTIAIAAIDPYCTTGPGTCSEQACVESYLGGVTSGIGPWYDENLSFQGKPLGALTPVGFYDHISVMNYCSTEGRYANYGVLSPGDLAAVQKLYGPPMGPPFGSAPINQTADPVSSQFPLSTVNLQTPGNLSTSCTGVILSSTASGFKVLTAAHCKVGSATTVQFYSTTVAGGAGGTGSVLTASSTTPVAIPSLVGACDPDVPGSFPSTCAVAGAAGSYFADLAVLTVDSPLPAGYVAVALGARGSLTEGTTLTSADGGSPGDMWEVGTGWGTVPPAVGTWAPLGSMQWGPAYPPGVAPGTPGSVQDFGGFFILTAPFTQRGDTGGPIFQYVSAPLTSQNGLVLLGITRAVGQCTDAATCNFGSTLNTYTSVVYPQNYDWLLGYGALPGKASADAGTSADDLASFGASL